MPTLKSGSTNRIKGELTALAVVRHREAGWTGSSGALRVHFATRNPDEDSPSSFMKWCILAAEQPRKATPTDNGGAKMRAVGHKLGLTAIVLQCRLMERRDA